MHLSHRLEHVVLDEPEGHRVDVCREKSEACPHANTDLQDRAGWFSIVVQHRAIEMIGQMSYPAKDTCRTEPRSTIVSSPTSRSLRSMSRHSLQSGHFCQAQTKQGTVHENKMIVGSPIEEAWLESTHEEPVLVAQLHVDYTLPHLPDVIVPELSGDLARNVLPFR